MGNLSSTVYDAVGNITASADALNHRTSFAYDSLNRQIQTTDALGDISTVVFDAAGNAVASIGARGNRTTMIYDSLNRNIGVTDALNHTNTTVFDAVGNATQRIDALNNATTMSYDSLNRQIAIQDPSGGINTTVYDADGNVTARVDPLGDRTSFSYDALNRQIQAQDARGGLTTTVYDLVGNVTGIVDSVRNHTTMVFDALNRKIQQTDPLNHSSTFVYDAASRMTSTTDRDGRIRNFTYDADNRETNETWIVGGSTVNTISYTFDAVGNDLTAANANGANTMTYDALNRVATEQEPFGQALTMTFDAVGNRTQLQDSKNGVTTSIYDAPNRVTTQEIGGTGQTPLRVDFTYTARDQIATETRYTDLAGTQKVGSSQFTYDNAMRETNIQHLNGSNAILANYTYVYDAANRLFQQAQPIMRPTTQGYEGSIDKRTSMVRVDTGYLRMDGIASMANSRQPELLERCKEQGLSENGTRLQAIHERGMKPLTILGVCGVSHRNRPPVH